MIMNGDIIRFNRKICKVEIEGSEGTYRIIAGKCVNCAEDNQGYLTDLETGYCFRAIWSDRTEIIKKFLKD